MFVLCASRAVYGLCIFVLVYWYMSTMCVKYSVGGRRGKEGRICGKPSVCVCVCVCVCKFVYVRRRESGKD